MYNNIACIKNRTEQNFKSDLAYSRKAELALCEWLSKLNIFTEIKNVNEKGHDIECIKKNTKQYIEVKRDFWTDNLCKRKGTNNICIELWSDFKIGHAGWIQYTDSQNIFYLSNRYLYILDTNRLKKFTNCVVNIGIPNKIEPKILISGLNMKITDAKRNGNLNVKNLIVNKNILIKDRCITNIIERNNNLLDTIVTKYSI